MPKQTPPDKIKYLTKPQVTSLLMAAKDNLRDYAILTTGYFHALRISEIGQLQLSDINLESRRLHTKRLKGGINASYRMSDETYLAIKKWLVVRGNAVGPLFPSRRSKVGEGEKGIRKSHLDTLFKVYAKKAGDIPIDRWNFHTLRHSCAVHMVDAGIPILQIKDWLGHRSVQSTMIYAVVSDLSRDKTAELFYGKDEVQVGGNGQGKEQGKVKKKGFGIDWKKAGM